MRTFSPQSKSGVVIGLASLAVLSLSQPASAARTKNASKPLAVLFRVHEMSDRGPRPMFVVLNDGRVVSPGADSGYQSIKYTQGGGALGSRRNDQI
jgi:hypothetical protein